MKLETYLFGISWTVFVVNLAMLSAVAYQFHLGDRNFSGWRILFSLVLIAMSLGYILCH